MEMETVGTEEEKKEWMTRIFFWHYWQTILPVKADTSWDGDHMSLENWIENNKITSLLHFEQIYVMSSGLSSLFFDDVKYEFSFLVCDLNEIVGNKINMTQ